MHDPAIGRFTGVDPIADRFAWVSPYNYAEDRVPNGIDFWGLQFMDANTGQSLGTANPLNSDRTISEEYDVNGNGVQDFYLEPVEVIADGGGNLTNMSSEEPQVVVPDYVPRSAQPTYDFSLSVGTSIAGGGASLSKHHYYSKSRGTWRGLNGKQYSIEAAPGKLRPFYGNQHTGSVNTAKAKASKIGKFGTLLGVYSVYATDREYRSSLKDGVGTNMRKLLARRYAYNQTMNAIGFVGPYGVAANIGHNLGYLIEWGCGCNIQFNPITKNFEPIEQTLTDFDNLGIEIEW